MAAPLSLRLARALGGAGTGGDASPPLAWSGAGSVALRCVDAGAAALRPAGAPLDAVARALAARPLVLVAGALLLTPLLALGGGPELLLVPGVAALAVVLGFGASLHVGEDRGDERRLVLRVLLLGALLRVALGAAVHVRGGFPDEWHIYHPVAADTAACWSLGGPSLLPTLSVVEGRALYFHLLSLGYLLGGADPVIGRLLGGFVGLLCAVTAGEVARKLGGARAAALAVALVSLHPELAFWSTTLSRDGLTTLLVLACLAAVLRRPGRLLGGNALVAAVPVALLSQTSFLAAGALAATLVVLAFGEGVRRAESSRGGAAALAASVVVGIAALVFVGHRYGAYFSPHLFGEVRGLGAGVDPDFLPGHRMETWLDVLLYAPAGALFVLFAPFPWDAVHLHRAAFGLLMLPGLAVTAAGLVGLAACARRRFAAAAPVLLAFVLLLGLLAVLEGNSGIVARHRLPLSALLCVGAAVLFAGRRDRVAT